jgi:flagellar biosynthesis/type III secretory pathway protein FliH
MTGAQALIQQGIERGIEQGIERGIRQGIQQGEIRTLLRQITSKFGAVSDTVHTQVAHLSPAELDALTEDILSLPDVSALENWLNEHQADQG